MLGENVTLDLLGDCVESSRLLKFLFGVFDLDLVLSLSVDCAYCRDLFFDDICRIISLYCVLSMMICVALALIVFTVYRDLEIFAV